MLDRLDNTPATNEVVRSLAMTLAAFGKPRSELLDSKGLLLIRIEEAKAEIERLLAGKFTEEEFQDLCHGFSADDMCRFKQGCQEYWRKLFGDIEPKSEFIRFKISDAKHEKTKEWLVLGCKSGVTIGVVKWYSPWRRYTFHPSMSTIFDANCLGSIGEFCEYQTRRHKAGKANGS